MKIVEILSTDKVYTYSQLKNLMQYKKKSESGKFSYYIRRLTMSGIIKKDGDYYLLTRIGFQVVDLLRKFKEICMSFDLSDCDADGKIEMIVVRK